MELPLAYYGDPILRKKGARINEITDEIRQLVADMVETMHAKKGIGLAAQQVHRALTLFITEVPIKNMDDPENPKWVEGPLRVFINPKIIAHSEETWTYDEGCLSIPGIYGNVVRPVAIKVQATDLEGNAFEEEFTWLDARAIMHENDHINGVLYIDRIHGKERQELEVKLQAFKKEKKADDS